MTTSQPAWNAASPVTMAPFTWNSGKPHMITLGPGTTTASIEATNASFRWECMATFGTPVVPPVWKYEQMSSGKMRRPDSAHRPARPQCLVELDDPHIAARGHVSLCRQLLQQDPRSRRRHRRATPATNTVRMEGQRSTTATALSHKRASGPGANATSASAPVSLTMLTMCSTSSIGLTGLAMPAAWAPSKA